MVLLNKLTFLIPIILSSNLFAHPQDLTKIVGKNIDLSYMDHAASGHVRGKLFYGYKNHGTFKSSLTMRSHHKNITSEFLPNEKGVQGTILEVRSNGNTHKTNVTLEKGDVDQVHQRLLLHINETPVPVQIIGEYRNNHFINPTYEFHHKGEKISFKIQDGQACYGMSIHLSMMILGAYFHES